MSTNEKALVAARRIDEVALEASKIYGSSQSFEDELKVAAAMTDLRALITPEVMKPVMALMNTALGFLTDRTGRANKDGKVLPPYSEDVVKDCFIESKMRGYHTIGNEWNILAGRFYATKDGLRRKIKTLPGVTDLRTSIGVPRTLGGGAIVVAKASWLLHGKPDSIEAEIPIKTDSYTGADAIIGKAERKLLKRVHDQITGTSTPEGEVEDTAAIAAPQPPRGQLFPPPPAEQAQHPKQKGAAASTMTDSSASEAEPEPTELQRFFEGEGINFEQFIGIGQETGWLDDPTSVGCWEDVPAATERLLLKRKDALLKAIRNWKEVNADNLPI